MVALETCPRLVYPCDYGRLLMGGKWSLRESLWDLGKEEFYVRAWDSQVMDRTGVISRLMTDPEAIMWRTRS